MHKTSHCKKSITPFSAMLLVAALVLFHASLPTPAQAVEVMSRTTLSTHPQGGPIHLTQEEQAYLDERTYLTMACDPEWPPFDFINQSGHHSGMAADFLHLISHRIDKPINLVPTESWEETLALAREGRFDLIAMLNETSDRTQYLSFTPPYFSTAFVIIGKTDVWMDISLDDLGDRKLALVKGYMFDEELRRRFPNVKTVEALTTEESLYMVHRGDAFAAVTTIIEASHFIRKNNLKNLKAIGEVPFENRPCLGVRKGDDILLSIMQKAVLSLTETEKQSILIKWVAGADDKKCPSEYWMLGGAMLLLVGIIIYWYRKNRSA